MKLEHPLRLGRGQNDRSAHWSGKAKRAKDDRATVAWLLRSKRSLTKPKPPAVVTITRIAPSAGLDDDNLSGACKGVRDAFAEWVGIDDKHRDLVRFEYAQERGPWGVRIEWA